MIVNMCEYKMMSREFVWGIIFIKTCHKKLCVHKIISNIKY